MSFLHGRRMDHSSLQERQGDERCTATAAVGSYWVEARLAYAQVYFVYTNTHKLTHTTAHLAGGLACKARWMTTKSRENKREQPGFISSPVCRELLSAEQLTTKLFCAV